MDYNIEPAPTRFKVLDVSDTKVTIMRYDVSKERTVKIQKTKSSSFFTVNGKRYYISPINIELDEPILVFMNQFEEKVEVLSTSNDRVVFRINGGKIHNVQLKDDKFFLYLGIKYNIDNFKEVG